MFGAYEVLGPDEANCPAEELDIELGSPLRTDEMGRCEATLVVFDSIKPTDQDGAEFNGQGAAPAHDAFLVAVIGVTSSQAAAASHWIVHSSPAPLEAQ